MVKLDFHCHSIASDGSESLIELHKRAMDVGLGIFILTDHCSEYTYFSNSLILKTLERLNYPFNSYIPIVIGSEIMTPFGEFLLFGKKACKQWARNRDYLYNSNSKDSNKWWNEFENLVLRKHTFSGSLELKYGPLLSYAMVMCHPRGYINEYESYPDKMYQLIHGFEIQNGNEHYDQDSPDVVSFLKSKIKNCKCLRNSDTHFDELGSVYNEIDLKELKELSENGIIQWLRSATNFG